MTDDLIERAFGLHDKLIKCHPRLALRQVWCRTCGATQHVENGLRDGWPKCCTYTMTIDGPTESAAAVTRAR